MAVRTLSIPQDLQVIYLALQSQDFDTHISLNESDDAFKNGILDENKAIKINFNNDRIDFCISDIKLFIGFLALFLRQTSLEDFNTLKDYMDNFIRFCELTK